MYSIPDQVLNLKQQAQYEQDGYFIVRGLLDRDAAMEVRGVIKNHLLLPDAEVVGDQADPMDPMGDTPAARAARFRKLSGYCGRSPVIWHQINTGSQLLRFAQHFLGDDLLLKFDSVFVKPAKTGSATPWHQDNGLWRDGDTASFNFWVAIDAATRQNGCMQFIPGTHRAPIETHVMYDPDAIHGELPRPRVAQMKLEHGVRHIELQPGDAVCWHANLYHYSPPNRSDHSRIAVAGVVSNPKLADRNPRHKHYRWLMQGGEACTAFPPGGYTAPGEPLACEPYPMAEGVAG